MNAPEPIAALLAERPAIAGAVQMPINLLAPSPTNPRRHRLDKEADERAWNLTELAASIEKHDVIQPILARPDPRAKAGDGKPPYEIVAGERRWRASLLAKKTSIITILREMTDFEVLELQLIENLQREDLHPLEEAEGYKKLLRTPTGLQGYANADELAARLGKSRRYVYNRLKLCELCKEARDACYDGKLTPSLALLVARMPADVQPQATKDITAGWGGEPWSFRQAQEQLQRTYMLQLGKAPFKITDANLVPKAGSCRECPKRTGANPDLFDDVKSADTCTDTKCFQAKTDAHHAALLKAGEEKGLEVITGAQAKKVMPHQHGDMKGYLALDKTNYNIADKPLGKLLGKECPPIALLENPHTHEVIEVVREDQAMAALKAKGVLKTSRVPSTNADQRAREAKAKAATAWKTAAVGVLLERVTQPDVDQAALAAFMWREVAIAMFDRLDGDNTMRAEKLMGWEHISTTYGENVSQSDARIRGLDEAELGRLFVAMCLASECHVNTYMTDTNRAPRINRFAEHFGVDISKIRRDLAGGAKAKVAAKKAAAKAPAAKNVGKPAAVTKASEQAKQATDAFVAAHDPKGKGDLLSDAHPPIVGERWKVKADIKGRSRTAGREGTVDHVDAGDTGSRVTLRWGPRGHQIGVYDLADLTFVGSKPAPAMQLSPEAAWPFPTVSKAAA